MAQATLSTRLMGAVTAVLVHEGDQVRAGQVLLRLDTRDLEARAAQAAAGVSAAEAQAAEAERYVVRIRALYADSAAPKALLDGAEAGLARARAGVVAARGAGSELAAVTQYGALRAPFSGTVTRRWVDPGAFAAPGAPLVTVEDAHRLRISVTTTPAVAQKLRRGMAIEARIEDLPASATIEGVVPVIGGGLYTVNAIVQDRDGRFPSGGAATLLLPTGRHRGLFVPTAAIARQGDLTGVRIWTGDRAELRWVRLGAERGDLVEVLSGLQGAESVVLPSIAEGD
jgi:RND family efflux transporter MFP subunit